MVFMSADGSGNFVVDDSDDVDGTMIGVIAYHRHIKTRNSSFRPFGAFRCYEFNVRSNDCRS